MSVTPGNLVLNVTSLSSSQSGRCWYDVPVLYLGKWAHSDTEIVCCISVQQTTWHSYGTAKTCEGKWDLCLREVGSWLQSDVASCAERSSVPKCVLLIVLCRSACFVPRIKTVVYTNVGVQLM